MVFKIVAFAEEAKLEDGLGNEGCLPSLKCPAKGSEYFI